ncbi:MAG: MarR family transcriptional regulator [Clostridia bacterium]|nr:MarR family transcriptional regulator [Clostridia bacterium]
MDKREQANKIIEKFKSKKPAQALNRVSVLDSGMRFVLMNLAQNDGEIYASTISETMNISRARCGILLKKMELKGYITRLTSSKDARIEIIHLTENGKQKADSLKEGLVSDVIKLIDIVGYKKLNEFLDIAIKIKDILDEKGGCCV